MNCDRLRDALPPKDSLLIPRTCANVTLRGRRVCADVIKDLEMGTTS